MSSLVKLSAMGLAGLLALSACPTKADEGNSRGACCGSEKGACSVDKLASAKECPVSASKKNGVVNTAALKTLLAAKASVTVLDARSGKYDDGKRIPGATQLSPNAGESVITQLLPDKKALVVTYCAGVKCPASSHLAERLKKLGYDNVIEYPEGIAGWIAAGNEVEQKGK